MVFWARVYQNIYSIPLRDTIHIITNIPPVAPGDLSRRAWEKMTRGNNFSLNTPV